MNSAHQRPWTAFYQPGVPAEIEPPTQSIPDVVREAGENWPDETATSFFNRTMTWRELNEQINRVAGYLWELGVRPGDRVGVMLPNCPQHVVALGAIFRLGAVSVEHNPLYTTNELQVMFADHGAKVMVAWDKAVARVQAIERPHRPDHVIAVRLTEEMPAAMRLALRLPIPSVRKKREALTEPTSDTIRWKDAVAAEPISEDIARPGVDDLAAIQYTSGTTGVPKGAMLAHRNLMSNALQAQAWLHGMKRGGNAYVVLPMFHAFGLMVFVVGTMMGMTLTLVPRPDTDLILQAWKKRPSTLIAGVPPIFERLANAAKESGQDIGSNEYCISGAMSLPHRITELWESVTDTPLIEGYGMTECSPIVGGNPVYHTRRPGTIGLPFPSTDVRVVDPEDPGRVMPAGEPGELLVKGPQVFEGYWNDPQTSAEALLEDGWLRTGDIVTQDEDGYLTMVDRSKDLIITGGFNVSPTEVEAVFAEHPDLTDVAVVGLLDDDGAERVAAAVVLTEGAQLDTAALRTFGKEKLANYKVPREFYEVDELPKNMLGKVLRKDVRDLLQERK